MQPIAKVDLSALVPVKKHNPYHGEHGHFASSNEATQKVGFTSKLDGLSKADQIAAIGKDMELHGKEVELDSGQIVAPIAFGSKFGSMTPGQWHAATGGKVLPSEFAKSFLGPEGLSNLDTGHVTVKVNSEGHAEMTASNVTIHGKQVQTIMRTVNMETGDVHHDYLKLVPGQEEGGMAKALFRDAIPMYEHMGLKSISVQANLDAGGFVWGRFGFNNADPHTAREFADGVQQKFHDTKFLKSDIGLGGAAHEEAKAVNRLLTSAQRPGSDNWQTLGRTYAHLEVPNLVAAFNKVHNDPPKDPATRRQMEEDGAVFKVKDSKGLLAHLAKHQEWMGKFDLTNAKDLADLKAYVKGK